MNSSVTAELKSVEARSAVFKKELGVRDLVLAQILTVVGGFGIGTAAKSGSAHLTIWLLAILFFFLPSASVVICLNRVMPLEDEAGKPWTGQEKEAGADKQ